MVEPLKAFVWRLPNGAAGIAAQHFAYNLAKDFTKWANTYNVDKNVCKWSNLNWYRGLKSHHRMLTMPEQYATMFLLSWTGINPHYIDEYVYPDEQ